MEQVGEGWNTGCDLCDCEAMVTPRRRNLEMPPAPGELGYPMTPEAMHDIISQEVGHIFGGEVTSYSYFTYHPAHGFAGEQLMRGIDGHEVPGHMRHMMRFTDRGDVIFNLRKAS